MLLPLVPPKQLWPVKAWTPQDLWMCPLVSGTKILAADHLCPVSYKVGPPQIGLVFPACPSDARWDWDPGTLEAEATPCTLCQVNDTHTPGCPHHLKQKVIHGTRPPCSLALWSSSDTHVLIVGTFSSALGSAWSLWPVCSYATSYAESCNALCFLTAAYHSQDEPFQQFVLQ